MGGMMAATFLAIFFVPLFFKLITDRHLTEKRTTGELREEWFNTAQEQGLNLYLCGHYATEVHGVKALAAELAKKFRVPWTFIGTENPL